MAGPVRDAIAAGCSTDFLQRDVPFLQRKIGESVGFLWIDGRGTLPSGYDEQFAMENPNHKWRFIAVEIIYKWAIYTMANC